MFKKDIGRIIFFSEISRKTNAIVSSSKHFFTWTWLVDLHRPFWIEIKVNEGTASKCFTHEMDGGWCTQAFSYLNLFFFFSFSLFIWSFRFSEAGSCLKITLFLFKPMEQSRLLIYLLVFILDRISPRRIRCVIMDRTVTSESIPTPTPGLFYSLNIIKLSLKSNLSSNPPVGFSSFSYRVIKSLFAPTIFFKCFFAMIYAASAALCIY